MFVVRVQGWDCCAITHSFWYHPDLPKGTKLSDLGIKGTEFDDDRNPDNLIKALKKLGFKGIKDQTITYGGNY